MREYRTLTREKVDVDPNASRYFGRETHLMQDWSDKLVDLVLNGPTLNGINKDELRAMLRETYASLKRYEQIGPMASPFMNDPTAIVARAFRELHPDLPYYAQLVPEIKDEKGEIAFGMTTFPNDGSTPVVCVSAEAPISAAPELLAHELAHVAAGEAAEHGPEWKAAEEAIAKKYDEILEAMIQSDHTEVIITPHKVGDGGILSMPLRASVPSPKSETWELTTCPVCGAECWLTDIAREALAAEPDLGAACTVCALKAGIRNERQRRE